MRCHVRAEQVRKQPEFNRLWRDHFGSEPKKIVYRVRDDHNSPHDFAFLSSLLHDARIVPEQVKLRGKQLTIPLERDCWEVYTGGDLYYTHSVLSIFPVQTVEWRFFHPVFREPGEALWVHFLNIASGESPPWTLNIDCMSWKCIVGIDSYSSRITLRDKTAPAPHPRPT
jgi:hypothetical protein